MDKKCVDGAIEKGTWREPKGKVGYKWRGKNGWEVKGNGRGKGKGEAKANVGSKGRGSNGRENKGKVGFTVRRGQKIVREKGGMGRE